MAQSSPSKSTMGHCQQQEMRWTQSWLGPCLEYQEEYCCILPQKPALFSQNFWWICKDNCCVFGQSSLSLQHHMIFISVHAGCDILGWLALDEIVVTVSFAFLKHESRLVPALEHEMLEPFYLLVHPYRCLPTGAAFWQCHSLIIAIMGRTVWCRISHGTGRRFQFVGWKWWTSLDGGKSLMEGWPTQIKSKILRSSKV
jgi:hypothetical protein